MFFRNTNKVGNINKDEQSTEVRKCKDTVSDLKTIADEKCRTFKEDIIGGRTNRDVFLWDAWKGKEECVKASKKVVEQVEQCLNLRKGLGTN
jgi:hypothetical protein